MAQSEKSKTEKSGNGASKFLNKYLFLYNFLQLSGWSYISFQFVVYYATERYNHVGLWNYVFLSVAVFQILALMEIVHAMLGLVNSSVAVTAIQILFRLMNTFGIFNLLPENINTIGVPMTLFAWCGAEVTRYFYFVLRKINFVPYFVTWIRYSAFIMLIPVGVSGELLSQYIVQSRYADKWKYLVPYFNVTVGYRHLIILMMLSSAQGLLLIYRHMFAQRRKALGIPAKPKQKSK